MVDTRVKISKANISISVKTGKLVIFLGILGLIKF